MAANCQANYYLDFARVGDRSSEWSSLFHRAIEVRKKHDRSQVGVEHHRADNTNTNFGL